MVQTDAQTDIMADILTNILTLIYKLYKNVNIFEVITRMINKDDDIHKSEAQQLQNGISKATL